MRLLLPRAVRVRHLAVFGVALGLSALGGNAIANTIQSISGPDVVLFEGRSARIPITLEADVGLAGFSLDVAVQDSTVAIITGAEVDGGFLFSVVDMSVAQSAKVSAVDLGGVFDSPDLVALFTLDIVALSPGSTSLTVDVLRLDDDDGSPILASVQPVAILVKAWPDLSGSPVSDLDGDGLAEDTNGNGRFDFDDLVLLFEQLNSAAVQNSPDLFDWNANGAIDFDDLVQMFQRIISDS